MRTLQRVILPNLSIKAEEEAYYHVSESVDLSRETKTLYCKKGTKISFDSFYNSFDVFIWKGRCDIQRLFLSLNGQGKVRVTCHYSRVGLVTKVYEEWECDLAENVPHELLSYSNIPPISGKVFFSITALEDIVFTGGKWESDVEAARDVKLGIVVTHFNRQQYVLPAIKRIENELLIDAAYKDKIKLIVVDNSKNLGVTNSERVEIIPNPNLGGSGGFTRGLLESIDGGYTHCLFMDDDGSCEIECIRRTYELFSLNKERADKFAISGVLLPENTPSVIHEKGAFFSKQGITRPNKIGLQITNFQSVLLADDDFNSPDYGAWCFLGFPLQGTQKYPFPFFVRGDDILFSLQNHFEIVTICGIGVYIDEFGPKESPLTTYLGSRSVFFITVAEFGANRFTFWKLFSQWYLLKLFSYHYDSANTTYLALKDLLQGGEIFLNDPDGSLRRKVIKEQTKFEQLQERTTFPVDFNDIRDESTLRKFKRFISLNGLFLPSCMLRNEIVFQPRGWRGCYRQIYKYKSIYYFSGIDGKGYVVQHDKKELLCGIFKWLSASICIILGYGKMRKQLQNLEQKATTEEFWRTLLELNKKS